MTLSLHSFSGAKSRRRIALVMAAAIVLAGIAQSAHYHKDDQGDFGGKDLHCLLCQYAGGTAAPPVVSTVPAALPPYRECQPPHAVPCPECLFPASYDARGPPKV
jgi:hypothetical protein